MDLIFASHNPHKVKEINMLLPKGLTVRSLSDIGFGHELVEDGATIHENARRKTDQLWDRTGFDCFADDTGLTKKDIAAVFDSLSGQIKKNLGGRGAPGMFTIPGLLKMRVVKKPAKKARKGINPFTGEETMFKAKPASKAVKVVALKGLKDMV